MYSITNWSVEALAKSLDTRALKNLAIFRPAVTGGPCNETNISVQICFCCNATSQILYYLEIHRLQCARQQCVELVNLPSVFLAFNIRALAWLLAQSLTALLTTCWLDVAETEQYLIKRYHCFHSYLPCLAAFPLQPSHLLDCFMVIGKQGWLKYTYNMGIPIFKYEKLSFWYAFMRFLESWYSYMGFLDVHDVWHR